MVSHMQHIFMYSACVYMLCDLNLFWVLIIAMYVNHHSVLTLLPSLHLHCIIHMRAFYHNGWTHTHRDFPSYNVRPFPPALSFLLLPSTHQPPYVKNLIIMIFVLQVGKSPLMIGLTNGHLDVVKTLIEAGAIVNQGDKVGVCALLLHSCKFTHYIALVPSVHN